MTPSRIVILNIISGLSLATCIIFGVTYMSFKNANVFQDIKIEITNNPVTGNSDIEFSVPVPAEDCKEPYPSIVM